MRRPHSESKSQALQDLSAAQVSTITARTGLSAQELCERLGCGTSQLFKYQKEGLPPRMNREVRAAILKLGIETGVLPDNALARASIAKLGKQPRRRKEASPEDDEPGQA